MHSQTPLTGALVCTSQNIPSSGSNSRPIDTQNSGKIQGGIITPLPMWRHSIHSVCSFDGGTRFSATFERKSNFCHFQSRCLDALRIHRTTHTPVEVLPGVNLRGAGFEERKYFRDDVKSAIVLVSDEWRIIIREDFFSTPLNSTSVVSLNSAVVIFSWRAFLQNPSIQSAYLRVCEFLSACGIHCKLDRINRVDVNVTFDDLPMETIRQAFLTGCFQTRTKAEAKERKHDVLGTLYIGDWKSPVMFRAYDKTAELRANIKTDEGREKLRYFRYVFGEESLTHLTRCEFEIHSAYLRDYHITDFAQLEKIFLAMLENMTVKWLRVLENPKDRNRSDRHIKRSKIAAWWRNLSEELRQFALMLEKEQLPAVRALHQKSTGERSKTRAFSWLKIAGLECLSLRELDLDEKTRNEIIEELGARLIVALKQESETPAPGGWGSGSELAWRYVVGNGEVI